VSVLTMVSAHWYEDDINLDFDFEPCPTLWADESLLIGAGIVSWSAAASLFDFDEYHCDGTRVHAYPGAPSARSATGRTPVLTVSLPPRCRF
jgi:hypothetical protein